MVLRDFLLLGFAAALAGAVNSVAGGGTLLTFPALVAALAGPLHSVAAAAVIANATSTVALFPGAIAAALGYRGEVRSAARWIGLLIGPSVAGGLIGAWLLVTMPSRAFWASVPWLILIAASLFASQGLIARRMEPRSDVVPGRWAIVGLMLAQFVVSVYGGYFGAGLGILMLSTLAFMGLADIHVMNGVKSVLGACINGTAVVLFAVEGKVDWPLALFMAAASIVGGYGGARVARRLNRRLVRGMVVALGFSLAAFYFYRQSTAG